MSQAVKVGLFVTLCLLVLGGLILQIEDFNLFGGEEREVFVLFDSVAGLNDKAPVRIAGVRVGQVDGVTLKGRQARVRLALDPDVDLPTGTTATIASAGILGDKYVELLPGPLGGSALPADAEILGETPVTFDEALERFDALGQSLQSLTGDVSREGDMGQTVRRLLDNLERTSEDIRLLVASNRAQVDGTIDNLQSTSETLASQLPVLAHQMRELVERIDSLVADNREDVDESLDNIRSLSQDVKTSVDNLNAITSQIRSGEGTVGKLLYNDEAHTQLVGALESVEAGVETLTDTLGGAADLKLTLGLEGAAYLDGDDDYAAFDLRVQSHPRRFYRLGVADGPVNNESVETRTLVTTLPDGTVETTVIEETKIEDDYTINAQVGYDLEDYGFGEFTIRAGLIESSGGGGIDYHLAQRRVTVTLEAFDFDDDSDDAEARVRFTTRFRLNPNVYLIGGYDDILADESDTFFFGAGITWNDEDIKFLLGAAAS
ncbi:MAG: MlaD family protein, partial [Acidobacteriota bacterium]